MKFRHLLFLFAFLESSLAFAGDPQIIMRYSEKPGFVRLVFEGESEGFFKDAQTFHSHSLVKIEFPSDFDFVPPEATGRFDVSKRGKSLFVTIIGLKRIKTFSLTGPPRLVIDAETEKTSSSQVGTPVEEAKRAELEGATLVIDPGHGGYEIGIIGTEYKEKDVVLSIAQSMRYVASRAGAGAYLTRASDRYMPIPERISEAFNRKPDFFLSIHLSSGPDFVIYTAMPEPRQSETGGQGLGHQQAGHLEKSGAAARALSEELRRRFKRKVRIERMPLPLLSAMPSPALLVELPDGKFLAYGDAERAALAQALLKGIGYDGKK